jgi:hypothetical protein
MAVVCRLGGLKRKAKMYDYIGSCDIKQTVSAYIGEINM